MGHGLIHYLCDPLEGISVGDGEMVKQTCIGPDCIALEACSLSHHSGGVEACILVEAVKGSLSRGASLSIIQG